MKGHPDSLKQPILQVISDAGHMVILDQPEAVNSLLFDWFNIRSLVKSDEIHQI